MMIYKIHYKSTEIKTIALANNLLLSANLRDKTSLRLKVRTRALLPHLSLLI